MSVTWDDPICSKCGDVYHGTWLAHTAECKYEPCEEVSCKAKKTPLTPHDVFQCYQHWKYHEQSPGHCAHGRRAE